ncbi:MAG: AAA family ATPase, partial [Micromonosporaceae bacterium]|nr:AAA family ATPase [Micromonosporaceae bacterium]
PTIREAIDAAPDDTVISVGPGEYTESLMLVDRRLTISAADGAGTVTIMAATPYEPVVSSSGGSIGLYQLTLKGNDGHCVDARSGKLKIEECDISSNLDAGVNVRDQAEFQITGCKLTGRYGIVIEDAGGSVDACEITKVSEDGIIVRMGADPVITSTTISSCGYRGIYVYQYGKPTIEGCDIAQTGGVGIGVAHNSNPTIRRSWVHDSQSVGIWFGAGCHGMVEDCTVTNTATPAVQVTDGATVEIVDLKDKEGSAKPIVGAAAATSAAGQRDEVKVESLLAELDSMIGLPGVKNEVKSIIDEMQVNEWRRSAGLSVTSTSNHLVFAGPPGTGKTTVARIYGKLLAALGVLPKGGFKEVASQDIVSHWIGHTATKTSEVFEEAMGGVLFIDEAYTLSRSEGGSGDHAREAIDTIVKMMEDHRHEIAVIAAGYTKEMAGFMDANPGLASRFAKTIEFGSYEPDELVLIIERIVRSDDYICTEDTMAAISEHFHRMERGPNFGNAREARKLFEEIRKGQAQRLRGLGRRPTSQELRTVEVDDVLLALGA